MLHKGIGIRAGRQACPLYLTKPIRDSALLVRCVIDDHRQQKRQGRRHQVTTVDTELPFEPKVSLSTNVRILRDHRYEQRAAFYLAADRRIPAVAAAKLALVEPHLDAGAAKRL